MEDGDVCPICCEALEDDRSPFAMRWPKCGHRFHTVCALTLAQYDTHCPICRCEGFEKRRPDVHDVLRQVFHTSFAPDRGGVEGWTIQTGSAAHAPVGEALVDAPAYPVVELRITNDAQTLARERATAVRRRRIIRSRPDLAALDLRVRHEQRRLRDLAYTLHREWSTMVRTSIRRLYATDPQILEIRRQYRCTRMRLWRSRRRLEAEVDAALPEPSARAYLRGSSR